MGKRLRKGDKVQVKGGRGYGNSIGTVIKRTSTGLIKVRFTTLRKSKKTYVDRYGKKKRITFGKTGTYSFFPSSLKRHKKKR